MVTDNPPQRPLTESRARLQLQQLVEDLGEAMRKVTEADTDRSLYGHFCVSEVVIGFDKDGAASALATTKVTFQKRPE